MKLEKERKTLAEGNTRTDRVINILSKKPKHKFAKAELLDVARDIKATIANIVRMIDGQE